MGQPVAGPSRGGQTMSDRPEAGPSQVDGGSRGLKRKRSEMRESISHGVTASQSIGLVRIDPVIFGSYEIHPWFSSPYVLTDPAPSSQDQTGSSSKVAAATNSAGRSTGSASGAGRATRTGTTVKESPGQKERVRLQPRNAGGRFTPKSNTSKTPVASPSPAKSAGTSAGGSTRRRRPSVAAPPLQLNLRSRDGPSTSGGQAIPLDAMATDAIESPGLSSTASTAPLDSPQLAAIYEPSYVSAKRDRGAMKPISGSSASHAPAEPSPLSNVIPLPSPSAPTSQPPTHPESAQSPKAPAPPPNAVDLPPAQQPQAAGSSARSPPPRARRRSTAMEPYPTVAVNVPPPPQPRGIRGRFASTKSSTTESKSPPKAAPTPKVNGLAPPLVVEPEALPTNEKKRKGLSRANSPIPPAPSLPTKLYVCDGCFKYVVSPHVYVQHKKSCTFNRPPGRKVYQRGAHIIWEVDGASARLYCQCLCLFGKLFIDHKYIFFDVEGFHFYVLTEATPSFDHVLGFFSKEKVSYDGYNLACIVTFPPYQKRGYGTLLIEFSYELDRHRLHEEALNGDGGVEIFGTPERPLSDLGARGYLAFWTSVLVRYFRKAFEQRRVPVNEDPEVIHGDDGPIRKVKGFEGEIVKVSPPHGRPGRPRRSVATDDPASEKSHTTQKPVSLRMTLGDISRATLLRTDDAAFALVQSGLAQWLTKKSGSKVTRAATDLEPVNGMNRAEIPPTDDLEIVVTPELVEEVAERTKVKRAVVDRQYLLL